MGERAASSKSPPDQANDAKPAVYVVDDDPVIRRALEFLLTAVGYRVVLCANGDEFLSHFVPGLRGCLILDVRMPGMNGFDLQGVLQRQAMTLPTIMISGNLGTEYNERAASAGVVAMIAKPFDNHVLLEHVRAALGDQADSFPSGDSVG